MVLSGAGAGKPGGLSAAASRVPRPKKSGNTLMDDQSEALCATTVELVDEIVKDTSHVMPLWTKLQERKQELQNNEFPVQGEMFAKTYLSLRKLIEEETEWVISYLSHVSDLSPEELVIATKHDREALEKLVTLDTQLCTSMHLVPSLLVRQIVARAVIPLGAEASARTGA